jgi:hypothetical protein
VINLDDQRFIGAVAWRQMEQTYDSGVITNKSIENLTLKAGYIGQVQEQHRPVQNGNVNQILPDHTCHFRPQILRHLRLAYQIHRYKSLLTFLAECVKAHYFFKLRRS